MLSLQPGFDEGYSLGAVLGLRVGWVLGVFEGLCAALHRSSESNSAEGNNEARESLKKMLGEARDALR